MKAKRGGISCHREISSEWETFLGNARSLLRTSNLYMLDCEFALKYFLDQD